MLNLTSLVSWRVSGFYYQEVCTYLTVVEFENFFNWLKRHFYTTQIHSVQIQLRFIHLDLYIYHFQSHITSNLNDNEKHTVMLFQIPLVIATDVLHPKRNLIITNLQGDLNLAEQWKGPCIVPALRFFCLTKNSQLAHRSLWISSRCSAFDYTMSKTRNALTTSQK